MDKEHGCGCAGGLGGGFELESPEPVMSTRGQDICWHLLLGPGQAAGFRAPARASYQACVKPPGSLVSLKLAPECAEPAWPYAFWSRPSGAAFMRILWIVNLLRGHEPVFDMASVLNTSTGETNYVTAFVCVYVCVIHMLRYEPNSWCLTHNPLYEPDLLVEKSDAFTHLLNSHSSQRSHRCRKKKH